MPPRRSSRIAIICAALLLANGLGAGAAAASSPKSQPGAVSASKKQSGTVKYREAPSGEKPAVRAKRLLRECRGRPNAGMCLGYAS